MEKLSPCASVAFVIDAEGIALLVKPDGCEPVKSNGAMITTAWVRLSLEEVISIGDAAHEIRRRMRGQI